MSYFGQSLRRVLEASGTRQIAFARSAGINPSSLSGYLNAERTVGRGILAQILQAAPEEYHGHLVRGWLLDQLPPEAIDLVDISPREGSSETGAVTVIETPCTNSVKQALENLARASVAPPVADMILSFGKAFDPDAEK